jgi:transcriptional regulator with XRE-family HTH domain
MHSIATLLDKAREHSRITSDSAIAERFGVSRQAVSQWRSGKDQPSDERIIALARLADIDPSPFLLLAAAARANGAAAKAWAELARRLGAVATSIAVALLTFSPIRADAFVSGSGASAGGQAEHGRPVYTLCALWLRGLRVSLRKMLRGFPSGLRSLASVAA